MILYSYKCGNGHVFDEFRAVEDRNNGAVCPECSVGATRTLTAPHYTGETQRRDRRRLTITPKEQILEDRGGELVKKRTP